MSGNQRQAWLAAGTVGMLAVALEAAGLRDALAWDRAALADQQLWRLATGHFVHLGWSHLALNLAGLTLLTWIVGRSFDALGWVVVALASILAMDIGFWFLYPTLDWYVGLSGLLYGLLAAGLVVGISRREIESLILGPLILARLVWEQVQGPLPGSEGATGGAVISTSRSYWMCHPIGDCFTMGPDESLRAIRMIRPSVSVPVHYNTFPLIEVNATEWAEKVARAGFVARVLAPGETIDV